MKTKGFTLEQHRDVGARLGAVRDEYQKLAVLIAHSYGTTKHKKTLRIIDELDKVRSDLDSALCSEHPEIDNRELINVYYGNRSSRKSKES